MGWNGMGYNMVPLFGFVKKEWNGVGWYPFHQMPPIKPIFHSIQFGVYPMEWNTLINNFNFAPTIIIISAALFFLSLHCFLFLLRFIIPRSPLLSSLLLLFINIHSINKVLFLNSIRLFHTFLFYSNREIDRQIFLFTSAICHSVKVQLCSSMHTGQLFSILTHQCCIHFYAH